MHYHSTHFQEKTQKKKKKGCLIFLLIIVCISILFGLLNNFGLLQVEDKAKLTASAKQIKEVCNVTDEQAIAIEEILISCEITPIEKIEYDDMLDGMFNAGDTGYRLQSKGVKNIIMYLNSEKEVIIVRHASIDLFSENTYKKKLSSFYLTTSQETTLQLSVQNGVKSIIKSPSSAKFPSITKWNFHRDPLTNIVTIASYVDSQNSFGAMIRSEFIVLYEITGDIEQGQYTLLYFEFDNQVIVDKR